MLLPSFLMSDIVAFDVIFTIIFPVMIITTLTMIIIITITTATPATTVSHRRMPPPTAPSPSPQYRLIMCLVVSAAAASPVFGPRSFRASQLQPPPQLGIRLVCCRQGIDHDLTRLLAQAARHPHLQETRLQLLCSGCPLSILAARLASCIRHDGRRYCVLKMIAYIMRRCIGKRFDCYRQPRSVHSGSHSFISWQ